MKTFFTSDLHLFHGNTIKYCKRPFRDIWEMNKTIVDNWNSVVSAGDTVYNLGDLAYGRDASGENVSQLVKQLKGNAHLIHGNHEKIGKSLKWYFKSMQDYLEIEVEGRRIVLFHYGMRTWHHDLRGVWHLYGHSHGGLPALGKSCDVGVDVWNFTPVSFEQLKEYMDKRPIGKHPKFEDFTPSDNQ